jgi:hypothetical protein
MKVSELVNLRYQDIAIKGVDESFRTVKFGTSDHHNCIVAYVNDDSYDMNELIEFLQKTIRYAAEKFVKEKYRLKQCQLDTLDQMIVSLAAKRVTYEQESK